MTESRHRLDEINYNPNPTTMLADDGSNWGNRICSLAGGERDGAFNILYQYHGETRRVGIAFPVDPILALV